jgi:hypothetical protein
VTTRGSVSYYSRPPSDGATQAQILLPGGLSRLGTQTVPLKRSSGIPQKRKEAESRAPLGQG